MLPKPRPQKLNYRQRYNLGRSNYQRFRKLALERDKGVCLLCGGRANDTHHIVFRSLGGSDEPDNLAAVCRQCHDDVHGHVVKLSGTATDLRIGRWSDARQDWVWGNS